MPTSLRLTRTDFKLFSSQKIHRTRGIYFTLASAVLPLGASPKVACVVSKKVAKRATDRNRIKRRCREILRPLMSQIKQPAALAFYANSSSNKATFEQLSQDIWTLLKTNHFLE